MAILEIIHFPDSRLRTQALPVTEVNDNIRQIVADMFETMYEAKGVGLAGTQVDIHQQIVVIDVTEERTQPICLINPEITAKQGQSVHEEGCLSVPEIQADVSRAEKISVQALNERGEQIGFETDGLLATCVQHELDHLKGKLFVDYLSPLKLRRLREKVQKQQLKDNREKKQSHRKATA